MMQNAKSVVTRIEFRIDAMRADAERIPLGYVVECLWSDMRWMGMIYRPSLTPNEIKRINFDTWPELRDPTVLLHDLFESAWAARHGHGSEGLTERFGALSALHSYVTDENSEFAANLADPSDAATAAKLNERLKRYESDLRAVCSAAILSLDVFRSLGGAKVKSFNAPIPSDELVAAVG
ncbi:hypothetical protein D3C72_343240 [compost metagenome]|mgnify:CR=1 FL=1